MKNCGQPSSPRFQNTNKVGLHNSVNSNVLGVYPAWETLLPQLLLLVITGVFLLYARNRQNQAAKLV